MSRREHVVIIPLNSRPVCGYLSIVDTDGVVVLTTAQWFWRNEKDEEQTTAPETLTSWSAKVLSGSCSIGPKGIDLGASNMAKRGAPLTAGQSIGDSNGKAVEHWYVTTATTCVIQIFGTIGGL